VRLNGIAPGDVVRVNRLGRVFLAEVTGTVPGGLQIVPADKRISYRQCRSREVLGWTPKYGLDEIVATAFRWQWESAIVKSDLRQQTSSVLPRA